MQPWIQILVNEHTETLLDSITPIEIADLFAHGLAIANCVSRNVTTNNLKVLSRYVSRVIPASYVLQRAIMFP
jgi:hypothetical protein